MKPIKNVASLKALSFLALVSFAPIPLLAATYYVSPTGSDTNPCTQVSPCATPDYAVNNKAAAGDTVLVAPGTYDYPGNTAATFTASGTAGNYITVTCSTKWACKIQNSATGNQLVVEIDSNYFTFDGFEVTNISSGGNNLGIDIVGVFVNVTRNKVHHIENDCGQNGGAGITTNNNNAHDITIDSNWIWDIGWPDGGFAVCPSTTVQMDGIITETIGANMVYTNNVIYHVSGGWGMGLGGRSGQNAAPITVANNTVFSNSNGGIIITNGADFSTVTNNLVFDNGVVAAQCGIHTFWATDAHILEANNDVFGNAGGDYCVNTGPIKQNNISVDPSLGTTFVNWKADGTGDYHLKSGSPAIDKGTSTGAPNHDFGGNSRPLSAGFDIGAYEFTNGSPPPPPPANACDLNNDGSVNSADVQNAVNQVLGVTSCTTADLQQNHQCSVADVQRVVNAALGGSCVVGP